MLDTTTRQHHLQQVNANAAFDGLQPDEQDKYWQQRYVQNTASIEDLLRQADAYAAACQASEETPHD